MKMWNRTLALLLALLLLVGLVGCTEIPTDSTDDTTMGAGSTVDPGSIEDPDNTEGPAVNSNAKVTCQYLPERIDNPENLPVLKWVCLTERAFGGGARTWNEAAAQELNQMLAQKKMPFRVQFVLLTMDQGMMYLNWFAYPQAQEALRDADLIYGAMTAEEMVQYLAPVTEYVTGNAEPCLKNSVPHPLNWGSGTVDGEIYGIRTTIPQAYSSGWKVDAELLSECNLTVEDFKRPFWEMDEVLAKIYEATGNKPFLYIKQDGTTRTSNPLSQEPETACPSAIAEMVPESYDLIGLCFAVDYSTQVPAVGNLLETDAVQKLQVAAVRYKQAGYTTTNSAGVRLRYTNVIGEMPYTYSIDGEVCVPVAESFYSATAPSGHVSGVAAVSKRKQEALQMLNLIAEDETFRMQLFYGKEGRDYKVENGYYSIIKQADGSNYSLDFLSPLAYFAGLNSYWKTADFSSPGTENWTLIQHSGKTVLQTYRDVLDQCESFDPIVFDYTGLEQELKAVQVVLQTYFPAFATSKMTPAAYNQMLQELKSAGSEKIVAQLQRQLDER